MEHSKNNSRQLLKAIPIFKSQCTKRTLFQPKTAQKRFPLELHIPTYLACIKEYPPPPPLHLSRTYFIPKRSNSMPSFGPKVLRTKTIHPLASYKCSCCSYKRVHSEGPNSTVFASRTALACQQVLSRKARSGKGRGWGG